MGLYLSVKDFIPLYILQIKDVEIWSDCGAVVDALKNPRDWPKYRSLLNRIHKTSGRFRSFDVKLSLSQANVVVRKIAKSVTKDSRMHSYLAVEGPTWLHNVIEADWLS